MEQVKELAEIEELLETKQYTKLRQYLADLNDAGIAGLMEELEQEDSFEEALGIYASLSVYFRVASAVLGI